jgi:hypothetical protein
LPPTNKGPVAIARANPTMMGTGTRQIEVLRTLADNTDGRVVVNTNDLGAGFRQIADDLSAYYLLGYASTNPALDGKFRQIEVKLVDQPRLSVSARKGYLAAAPRASSMPSTAPDDVSEALARLPRPGDNDASALRPASGPHVFVGDPAAYRGAASPRIPLQPAPGFVFRRTERLHVEWPALKAVDEHIARLLDRNGRPLPLVVALTVQADKIAADLNLAPLGEGDYVIELTAGANGQVEKQLLAFRVVR